MGGDDGRVRTVRLGAVLATKPRNGYSPKDVPEWTGLQALGLGCLTANGFAPVQLKNVPDTALARRCVLADGDVLISRANTRDLVGLVGRYVSDGHPCIYPDLMMRLRPDESRCLPAYLELVLRSNEVRKAVRAGARGTSDSMVKISSALIEGLEIPLPPLDEQRRIIAVHAAFEQRIGALEGARAKLESARHAAVAQAVNAAWRCGTVPCKDVLQRIETGWSPVCSPRPPARDEWGVLKLSAVTSGRFREGEAKALPPEIGPRPALEVRPGDVLVSRANGVKSLVGVACTVGHVRRKLLIPDLVFRLVADTERLDSEFLGVFLATNEARRQIDDMMRGSSGQYKISQTDVLKLLVPRVGLAEQREVVTTGAVFERRITAVSAQVTKLRTIQLAAVEDLLNSHS